MQCNTIQYSEISEVLFVFIADWQAGEELGGGEGGVFRFFQLPTIGCPCEKVFICWVGALMKWPIALWAMGGSSLPFMLHVCFAGFFF